MISSQRVADAAGGLRLGLAEDVRVPADELGVHAARDRLEIAVALLFEQQGEEIDLEEQVAELVEQLRRLAGRRGVSDLVGLLDRVRARSCGPSARGPRGSRGAAAASGPVARQAPRREASSYPSRWWRSSRWRRGGRAEADLAYEILSL